MKRFQYSPWLNNGFWAILDQAFFAISNFALNVILIRWLTTYDYGIFSVILAIHVLIGAFHSTIFTEPMLVFGSERYKESIPSYLGLLIYGHGIFSLLCGLLLIFIALGLAMAGQESFSTGLLYLGINSPWILLYWKLRRAPYIFLRPRLAAIGSFIYFLGIILGIAILYQNELLNSATGLFAMGFASIPPSILMFFSLKIRFPPFQMDQFANQIFADHRHYGRWAFSTSLLKWIPGNIYYFLLPMWGGIEASAALRAMLNLTTPILQVFNALGGLLVPTFVKTKNQKGFGVGVLQVLGVFTLGGTLYWLAIGIFGPLIIEHLYNGEFIQYADFLWILGLYPILAGVIAVLGSLLRAVNRPDLIFWSYIASTGVILTLGIGIIKLWGLWGVGLSMLVCYGLITIMMSWYVWNHSLFPMEQRKVLSETF